MPGYQFNNIFCFVKSKNEDKISGKETAKIILYLHFPRLRHHWLSPPLSYLLGTKDVLINCKSTDHLNDKTLSWLILQILRAWAIKVGTFGNFYHFTLHQQHLHLCFVK